MGNGRGLIGALSAIGNDLINEDFTYELLAYRRKDFIGKKRKIKESSVWKLEGASTFANVDYETKRVLVYPRGNDPVLFGIRGESPEILYKALHLIEVEEPIDRWVIFITNQGTDAHFRSCKALRKAHEYEQVILEGEMTRDPERVTGGHIILRIHADTLEYTCIAYFESGKMRRIVGKLRSGDVIRVFGGIKPKPQGLTVNIQKLVILDLQSRYKVRPVCPRCGKRMISLGREKGFKCKCGYHVESTFSTISAGRGYIPDIVLPPYRSIRHLTKPIKRYGRERRRERRQITFSPWCSFLDT